MSLMEPKIDLVRQFYNLRLNGSIEKHHLVIKTGFEHTRPYIAIISFVYMKMYSKCSECPSNDISLLYIFIYICIFLYFIFKNIFSIVIYWKKYLHFLLF